MRTSKLSLRLHSAYFNPSEKNQTSLTTQTTMQTATSEEDHLPGERLKRSFFPKNFRFHWQNRVEEKQGEQSKLNFKKTHHLTTLALAYLSLNPLINP